MNEFKQNKYSPFEYYDLLGSCIIYGHAISKSNEKLRGKSGHYVLSDSMKAYENKIQFMAVSQMPKVKGLAEGWVVISPTFKDKRHCDLSNLPKSIFDALVKAGTFTDDKSVAVTVLPAKYAKDEKVVLEVWGNVEEVK